MTQDKSKQEMPDVKFDEEKLQIEAQDFIAKYKAKMKLIADECLGDLYVNVMPYIQTDTWTNYRESLRIELEHEYKFSNFKQDWATNFRRAVFVENREEISKLIESDILKRIKHLEDCKQEFEQFRYTPLVDTYQDLKSRCEELEREIAKLKAQLWVAKDSALRTYDSMAEKADKYDEIERLKDK